MTKYRVVMQPPTDDGASRRPWDEHIRPYPAFIIDAEDFADALCQIIRNDSLQGLVPVAIEIVGPGAHASDEDIVKALTQNPPWALDEPIMDPDCFDPEEVLFDRSDFGSTAAEVAERLRVTRIVPGLTLSLLWSSEGVDYSMVEVFQGPMMRYLAVGAELDRLTDDVMAKGWDGVVAIARGLISLASPLV